MLTGFFAELFFNFGVLATLFLVVKMYWHIILIYAGIFASYKLVMKLADQADAERTGMESIKVRVIIWSIFICLSGSVFGIATWLDDKYEYSEVAIELAIEGNEKLVDKYEEYKSNLTE